MFVSWIKYKRLVDARNKLFLDEELKIQQLEAKLKQKEIELKKYKELYSDELTKRLFLTEQVRKMEGKE